MAVDPILRDLQYALETSQEVDVLNFYQSFPITARARVQAIDHEEVTLRVQPPGSVCLLREEETLLLSRGLPEAVRARIVTFDLLEGLLQLSDFAYVGTHFGDRMIARVQPQETTPIQVEVQGQTFTGTLLDVSLSGVGVYVDSDGIRRGDLLNLTLPLPEGSVTLPGKILNITQKPGDPPRFSIGFTRNAQEITVVMRYIKGRRGEILEEVQKMYQQAIDQTRHAPIV